MLLGNNQLWSGKSNFALPHYTLPTVVISVEYYSHIYILLCTFALSSAKLRNVLCSGLLVLCTHCHAEAQDDQLCV